VAALIAALLFVCVAAAAASPRVSSDWIERVYPAGNPEPVWFTAAAPRPATGVALQVLQAAGDQGLAPEDYDAGALEREIAALAGGSSDVAAIVRVDRALTAAFLQFLSDVRFGRVPPQQVAPHYRAPAKDAAFVGELRDAVARDRVTAMIDAAEPQLEVYGRLKRLLAHYRALAREPPAALPPLGAGQRKIAVGDAYAALPALTAVLARLGDLPPDAASSADDRYSAAVADAVRRFQARHGLQPDGILGRETLAALNVPLSERVTQIALSLERLRWLPAFAGGPLVAINIPSFELWAFADASPGHRAALSMPIVVGRALRTETPVFIGAMRFVEFSPYWNVPPSILRNELLPRLARDPSYAAREDMEVVSTSGAQRVYATVDVAAIAALRAGEARLRQRPGTKNALGGVKFVLPNTMDIYLHATPARELFERTRRDFSHGCIRLRDPQELAQFVLQGRPEWTPDAIAAAMGSGVNRIVPLARPVPVVVFYTTAIVDRAGRALFFADIYGHDRKLQDALARRARSSG
jgi:murein L,D-transpeptidase YcbB/YkuD